MIYVFVFLGEFGYELFNWQGVIRKFTSTIGSNDKIICCSRANLFPFYEKADLYVDISELPKYKKSVASGYSACLPEHLNQLLPANIVFDLELKAEIRWFVMQYLKKENPYLEIGSVYDDFKFVYSTSRTVLNGCVFGADTENPTSVNAWPDIYEQLDVTNNHFVKIDYNPPSIRATVESSLGFNLSEPYILCQNRQRKIVVRSDVTFPFNEIIACLAQRFKIILLTFDTGRSFDSYSAFTKNENCYEFKCSSFLEQSVLISGAKSCVFFTEGDLGSHIYVPPFMGKEVFCVASQEIYNLDTAPIDFWNRSVFRFGGKIRPYAAEKLFAPALASVRVFADTVTKKIYLEAYLQNLEDLARNSELQNLYLWPRTPLGVDHQDKIIERVGVSDYQVEDPRSRSFLIINQLKKMISTGSLPEDFFLLDVACGDAVILCQIQKEFPRSFCFGIDCLKNKFDTHTSAQEEGIFLYEGYIQHLFANQVDPPFDVVMMLNSYRGWESAELRPSERELPEQADRWFARNAKFTILTATEHQITSLQNKSFSVNLLGKGEDNSHMIIAHMSTKDRMEDVQKTIVEKTGDPPEVFNWQQPKMEPFEIEALTQLLRSYVQPISTLEWGSGASTTCFASRLPYGSSWDSIENEAGWFGRITAHVSRWGDQSIRVHYCPPVGEFYHGKEDGNFINFRDYILYPTKLTKRFDLILVDGRARVECMAVGWDLLARNGVMILHDASRPEYQSGIPSDCFFVRVTSHEYDKFGGVPSILFMAKEPEPLKRFLHRLIQTTGMKGFVDHNIITGNETKGRILFLNTYYSGFLKTHYQANLKLDKLSYWQQKRILLEQCFGDSDFYSSGMIAAGWDADDIVVNCSEMQSAWARENGINHQNTGLITIEQVRRFEPDVIYLQDLSLATPELLAALRPFTRLIAGQIASPVPPRADLTGIDVLFSSFPHFVQDFRSHGKTAWYQPLAFEPRLLQRIPERERIYPATFVGGISPHHGKGLETLQTIAGLVPIDFWGYGSSSLSPGSPIRQQHHGELWGLDMFDILRQSAVTLNRHIDVAGDCANNMRLFEATGCGALLLTDYRHNLNDLFEIGREVVAYRSPEEAAALISYYQRYPEEAESIAKAGQERTLRDHTYTRRMQQTAEILERQLRYGREQGRYPLPIMISSNYRPISAEETTEAMTQAWKDTDIPARQRGLVQIELGQMYAGQVKPHFSALADLIRPYVQNSSSILELGCASGYYYEILEYLLGRRIDYTGVDYSEAMIAMARDFYPRPQFFAADAKCLFFADRQFDLVVSSCILQHVPNYRQHIEETCRVARELIIAHRTPVCRNKPTRRMAKQAYGVETVEFCLNEQEILLHFSLQGFELIAERIITSIRDHDEYDISYLFRKIVSS